MRMSSRSGWRCLCIVSLAALLLPGCATTPKAEKTTRLQEADFDYTVGEMAADLAASDLLTARTPQSPQMRIVTRKVQNLSSDVIQSSALWTLVARVQHAMPMVSLANNRNIVFQIGPEQVDALRREGFDMTLAPEDRPTHTMNAVYRSATRSSDQKDGYADLRKDYYYLEYRIIDLDTREMVWTGAVEFAREASGLVID